MRVSLFIILATVVFAGVGMGTANASHYYPSPAEAWYSSGSDTAQSASRSRRAKRKYRNGKSYRSNRNYRGTRKTRSARNSNSGASSSYRATASRGGAGPRPRQWCGWWMRTQRGGGRELNVAWNWSRWGRASGAQVGAVVVWRHHVGEIVGRAANGKWLVRSGNDGGRVRTRARSVAGAVFRMG
jgi:hypothetical protein